MDPGTLQGEHPGVRIGDFPLLVWVKIPCESLGFPLHPIVVNFHDIEYLWNMVGHEQSEIN